jgi:hypothetical protein
MEDVRGVPKTRFRFIRTVMRRSHTDGYRRAPRLGHDGSAKYMCLKFKFYTSTAALKGGHTDIDTTMVVFLVVFPTYPGVYIPYVYRRLVF